MIPEYKEIKKDELEMYRHLILPMVYDELMQQENINTDYICIASWLGGEPVGVIIVDLEGNGDLNLLSIWTDQRYRRMGVASALKDKMTFVAVNLYDWDDAQYGDNVFLRTMYCLADEYREPFEGWLMANDFTDFGILSKGAIDSPEKCCATAEINFMRFTG